MLGRILTVFVGMLAAPALALQRGDVQGEEQKPLPAELVVPRAPALSAEDERATFQVPDDVELELAAGDPLVHDPIAIAFDADEAMWVVEMSDYMPDVDGNGEREPTGRIVVLTDTDGDGRMDHRTVFLDHLVLPRAVRIVRGGALVIAPPELLFCRDTDGDGVCDEKTVIDRGLEGLASPEWAINSLLPTIDNALYCAKAPWRYVFREETWKRDASAGSGQWGATEDDQGRIFTDNNSDPLRCDFVPAIYAVRNSNLGRVAGVDVRVVDDFVPRPSRVNPGINRGYQPKMLTKDFKLALVTGTCAPCILRGDRTPARYRGNAIVCEPTGNLVIDYALVEDARGNLRGAPNHFGASGLDFWTSTDERFRPVFACEGPDGALYVADIYRGVLQHKNFVTSFLRKQVLDRGLEKPIGLGRIWRVAQKGSKRAAKKKLADTSDEELVDALADADGWRRDTAQRLIVEAFAPTTKATAKLRELASKAPLWQTREQALWSLAGIGAMTRDSALAGLADGDARVAMAALRTSESLAASDERIFARWLELAKSQDFRVRRQAIFSLGALSSDRALAALLDCAFADCSSDELRTAIVSGLGSRELEFLEHWFTDARSKDDAVGRSELVELLARCVVVDGRSEKVEQLIELVSTSTRDADVRALARGALAGRPPDPLGKPGYIRVAREPRNWNSTSDVELAKTPELAQLREAIAWPGKPGVNDVAVRELNEAELARFRRGRELFAATCAACHQANGAGQSGAIPPLRASPFALGKEERVVRILLQGLQGPIVVRDGHFDGEMPGYAANDEDLAAVLTYVRREWGNGAEPITRETVAKIREATRARSRQWTIEELEPFAK